MLHRRQKVSGVDIRGATIWTTLTPMTYDEAYAHIMYRYGDTHQAERVTIHQGQDGTNFVVAKLRFVGMPGVREG